MEEYIEEINSYELIETLLIEKQELRDEIKQLKENGY